MKNELGIKIYIKPEDLQGFATTNKERLDKELVLIAENTQTKFSIYITQEKDGLSHLLVYRDDVLINDEEIVMLGMYEKSCKQMYARYLFPVCIGYGQTAIDNVTAEKEAKDNKVVGMADLEEDEEYEEGFTRQESEDEIYTREDELYLAASDFLEVLLGANSALEIEAVYGRDIITIFLDMVCETVMAEMMGVSVYRPTFIDDETVGEEVYVEYPYDVFIDEYNDYDEEGNPIPIRTAPPAKDEKEK